MTKNITILELDQNDIEQAKLIAERKGFAESEIVYTSNSLPGLYCENRKGKGVVIKTKEFGLLFVQDEEDLGIS